MTDLSPANWLIQEVTGFEGRVRDVVPATYDAFARLVSEENLPLPLLRDVQIGRASCRERVLRLV